MTGTWKNRIFAGLCRSAAFLSVGLVFFLLGHVIYQGCGSLSFGFLSRMPSEMFPERAGFKLALVGSMWLISLTSVISVPIGVATAIYLEEYSRATPLRRLIQLNIANLAGVPSIVYGILGLGLFVRFFAFQKSVLSGSLTLSLVILPIVILAAQEALRSVPDSIRMASHALGATKWQTVWHQVLPAAMPAIMSGVILALSRAIGEAAPILVVGAVANATFVPQSIMDPFGAMPVQIFDWAGRSQKEFHELAGAGIIVLLAFLIVMNTIAVFVRYRYSRNIRW